MLGVILSQIFPTGHMFMGFACQKRSGIPNPHISEGCVEKTFGNHLKWRGHRWDNRTSLSLGPAYPLNSALLVNAGRSHGVKRGFQLPCRNYMVEL